MSQMLNTKAIVLRRTNYGESDRILTLLTPKDGRLSAIARSVRREKSKLAGGIELFAICDLGLVRSDNNVDGLWTVRSSRLDVFFDHIMADYDRLQFGYEAIQRISKLADLIVTPELYDILRQTLMGLNNEKANFNLIKAWFYLWLARVQGAELNLLTDSNGMQLIEDASYDYSALDNLFTFNAKGRYDSRVIKLLRFLSVNEMSVVARVANVDNDVLRHVLHLATANIESV